MEKKLTYYDILGVPRTAKLTDITRAYNRHKSEVTRDTAPPDLKRETLIRVAFETLSDDRLRDAYDASLVAPDRRYRSRKRAIWVGAIGVAAAAAYLAFFRPAPQPVAAARTPQELLADVSPAIGRVHRIDISGSSLPVGMAFAIGDGVLVTTCDGLTPDAQLVLHVAPRRIPARVASVDAQHGLCRLSAPGVGSRPLDLARPDTKRGDLVYAAKVDASGNVALTGTTVQAIAFEPQGRVVVAGASGINGAPLLDPEGRVVGVSTDGKGRHLAVPTVWMAQAREQPVRETKREPEKAEPVLPKKSAEEERYERLEAEIGKMK